MTESKDLKNEYDTTIIELSSVLSKILQNNKAEGDEKSDTAIEDHKISSETIKSGPDSEIVHKMIFKMLETFYSSFHSYFEQKYIEVGDFLGEKECNSFHEIITYAIAQTKNTELCPDFEWAELKTQKLQFIDSLSLLGEVFNADDIEAEA